MADPAAEQGFQKAILASLQVSLFDNRGMLQPAQLRQIAADLLQLSRLDALPSEGLGSRLNDYGLAFSALIHACSALVGALLREQQHERAGVAISRLSKVIENYYHTEIQRIYAEQQLMHEAVQRAMVRRTQEAVQLQREISERKQVEEMLQRAKEAAEAANQAKTTFLANMSHELRTPLNAILGYAQILQLQSTARGQTEILPTLEKIRTAGKHLLAIISDILDLSKIEADKMQLSLETFAIAPLVGDLIATAMPLMVQNANRLVVDYPDNLGMMHTDRHKIQQVLLNLLSNAAKFTEHGTVSLTVKRERQGYADCVVFVVADTGIGIKAEDLDLLFKPFSQASAPATRKPGGTGLGLAISHQLCRMLGGDVTVASTPSQGSTFTVTLPTAISEPPAP